jgi:hypothetical protein
VSPREATEIMALIETHTRTLELSPDRNKTHRLGTHRTGKGAAAMTLRRLRARLDRLALSIGTLPGKDRDYDRRRRGELQNRRLWPGLNGEEEAELSTLDTLFQAEDQASGRWQEIVFKQVMGAIKGADFLTESEKQEVAEHERRYPPVPRNEANDPFKKTMERIRAVVEEYRRAESKPSPSGGRLKLASSFGFVVPAVEGD